MSDGIVPTLRRLPAYIYLNDLFRDRKVLEIGCGDGASADYLARAGAAHVIGVERATAAVEAARSRYPQPNLTFVAGDLNALELEDRSVDVVCIPAGGELVRWVGFLEEVRRVLAKDGLVVATTPSGDRPDTKGGVAYHDLVTRLEPLFGGVRMVGVTPFVGVALVEFADDEEIPELELDTSLCALGSGRERVTEYVAVAGSPAGTARSYMVVEMPTWEGMYIMGELLGSPVGEVRVLEERLRESEALAAETLARLRDLEGRPPRAETPAATRDRHPEVTGGRIEELELRRRLTRAVEERTSADAEVQQVRERLAQAEEEIGRVAAQAAIEIAEARQRAQAAEQAAAGRAPAGGLGVMAAQDAEAAEVARLQIALEGRAREVATLLVDREQLEWRVAELAAKLWSRDEELARLRVDRVAAEVVTRAAEAHEREMAERRAELAERDALVDELQEELEDVAAAQRRSAEEARGTAGRLEEAEGEIRGLRARLAQAEGALLKVRLSDAHDMSPPTPATAGGGSGRDLAAPAPAAPAPEPPVAALAPTEPTPPAPDLTARVAELEASLLDQTTALDKATSRWKEAEGKSDELWRKIGDLQKELTSGREQAVENARAQRQAAQIALTRAVEEASKKLVSVQDQAIRTERERKDLEEQRNALRERVAELDLELAAARDAATPRVDVVELDAVITALDDGLRAEEDRLSALEDRLRAIAPPASNGDAAERLAAREERIRVLSTELGERDAELAILRDTATAAKRRVAELLGLIRHAREQAPSDAAVAALDQLVRDATRVV